jgi:hypothetical protein
MGDCHVGPRAVRHGHRCHPSVTRLTIQEATRIMPAAARNWDISSGWMEAVFESSSFHADRTALLRNLTAIPFTPKYRPVAS